MSSYLVVDLESAGLPECADILDAPQAPANYKDEAKISAYVAAEKARQLDKLALDPDCCRIVTMVWEFQNIPDFTTAVQWVQAIIPDEATERDVLGQFWCDWAGLRPLPGTIGAQLAHAPLRIGFHISRFDLPVLLRRSLYLGVPTPKIELSRYRHPGIEDLAQILSNDWQGPMHSLAFYAKRFGLGEALGKGSEVGALIAAGDYESVLAHNVRDVELTTALAKRMGVI